MFWLRETLYQLKYDKNDGDKIKLIHPDTKEEKIDMFILKF